MNLEQKPFLTTEYSGVDVEKNGWAGGLFPSQVDDMIVSEAKRRKLKYRRVGVLSKNLRGKLDLRGNRYRPIYFMFVQVK